MPLRTQNIDLRFASGVDTKTDSNNVLFTSFQELKESRIDQIGAVIPRGGFVSGTLNLPGPTNYPSFALTSNGTYTVIGTSNTARLKTTTSNINIGPNVRGGFLRLAAGRVYPHTSSVATDGSTVCHVWTIPDTATGSLTNRVGIVVYDSTTNAVIVREVLTVWASQATVQARAIVMHVFGLYHIVVKTATTIEVYRLSADFTSIVKRTIASGSGFPTATGYLRMDAAPSIANDAIYIAYALDGSSTVSVLQLTQNLSGALVGASTTAFTMASAAKCLNVLPYTGITNAQAAIFAGGANGIMQGVVLSSALASLSSTTSTGAYAGTDFKRSLSYVDGTKAICKFDFMLADGFVRNSYVQFQPSGPSSGYVSTIRGYMAVTSATIIDGIPYAIHEADTAATYGSHVLASIGVSSIISGAARFASGKNIGQSWNEPEVGALPRPAIVGNKVYWAVDLVTGVESLSPGNTALIPFSEAATVNPYVTSSLLQWDLDEVLPNYITVANNEALYLGSAPRDIGAYDGPGVPWPECTFRDANMTKTAMTGGSTAPTGVVSYVFAKLYTSPSGVEYRTYSTIYVANFTSTNQTMSVTIPSDSYVASTTQFATLELYRTERNGSIFYRCASGIPNTSTYVDNMSEADLLSQRIADIAGAELYPESMPALRAVTAFKSRLAYVDCDDPNTIKFDRGTAAPAGTTATSGISVDAPSEGGPVTTLQQMDGALYIFKTNSIWTVYGDVPTATGEGGTLSTPSLVFNGIGCNSPRSVVLTSKGILFKGAKGIYLLMRNQEIAFMGQGPYNDRSETIVGSGIGENQAEVYFVHASGKIWVLNMDLNAWYEWVYSSSLKGAVVANKKLLVLSDSAVITVDPAITTDQPLSPSPATPIVQDITTGWLRMDGIEGFQRVKKINFLIESLAATTVTIDIYTDYNDAAPTQTVTVNTNDLALTATGNRSFEMHVKQQKAAATKFRIRTAGYGVKFSGATMAVAIKDGLAKNTSNAY